MTMYRMNKEQRAAYVESLPYVKDARTPERAASWRKFFSEKEYIVFDGGEVMKIDRPSISPDLWYDDELPDPMNSGNKEALFTQNNMRKFNDYDLTEWQKCRADLENNGCCLGWYVDKPYLMANERETWPIFLDRCQREGERNQILVEQNGFTRRELSAQEIEQFAAIVDELRAEYARRLKTYFNRYASKICSRGYWANR